jgi:Coenzyme PQQ synthesis protein D (PqqD)
VAKVRRMRPAPSIHTRLFDGELVILDLAHGEYLALDAIGSVLWAGLEAGRTVGDVATEVAAQYDVSLEQATADLETLAEDLVARGLFVVDDEP